MFVLLVQSGRGRQCEKDTEKIKGMKGEEKGKRKRKREKKKRKWEGERDGGGGERLREKGEMWEGE
jgi:hypothetical protein